MSLAVSTCPHLTFKLLGGRVAAAREGGSRVLLPTPHTPTLSECAPFLSVEQGTVTAALPTWRVCSVDRLT